MKTKETYPTRPGPFTPCKQALRQAKQQLCTSITLFCTFLCRRCTNNDAKQPNFRFCGQREHKTTTLFVSWTFIPSFRIQLQKNSPKFDELNEIEYALISLKPSLLLKLPIYLLQSEVLKDIEHSGVTFGTGSVLHRILGFRMTSSKLKNREELSILLSIYFHEVLKQQKTFTIFTEFRFERGSCVTI